MPHSSRTAIVTGGSRGIGHAIAKRLAQAGFSVAIQYAHSRGPAEALVAEIESLGGNALAVRGDVATLEDVQTLFKAAKEAYGRIDIVVNSAGIMTNTPVSAGDLEAFDRMMAVNLRGTFLMLSQAAQQVERGGRIIALSSSVIAKSLPTYGPYIATKAGVEGLVRVLANELRGQDITVNAIAPGPVATELFLNDKSEEQIRQIEQATPLERLGTSEDIAEVVAFLASPAGSWINAQVIRANGGFA